MFLIFSIFRWVTLLVAVGFFAVEVRAFFDCAKRSDDDFRRAYKRSRGFWLAVTASAGVVGLLSLLRAVDMSFVFSKTIFFSGFDVIGMVSVAAVIAAGVYLADVRPAL